jgi:hypothetical protein
VLGAARTGTECKIDCRTHVLSCAARTFASMSPLSTRLRAGLYDALDLVIEFATLGEYGLEELPEDGPGCEGSGRTHGVPARSRDSWHGGWEALAPARRSSARARA